MSVHTPLQTIEGDWQEEEPEDEPEPDDELEEPDDEEPEDEEAPDDEELEDEEPDELPELDEPDEDEPEEEEAAPEEEEPEDGEEPDDDVDAPASPLGSTGVLPFEEPHAGAHGVDARMPRQTIVPRAVFMGGAPTQDPYR
jgi:hypothetical protein